MKKEYENYPYNEINEKYDGIYKFKSYRSGGWYAYFKPRGWKQWGNSCEQYRFCRSSVLYKTLVAAREAARRHKMKFGGNPTAIQIILIDK